MGSRMVGPVNATTETITSAATAQANLPCPNLVTGICTQRVHEAMGRMLAGQDKGPYRGGLFPSGKYPSFEEGRGAQYVSEYLPLHLPQLEYGLEMAYRSLQGTLSAGRAIRLLDIGSGPASVALALERLTAMGKINAQFQVQPLEQSAEFCGMLREAADPLGSGAVKLMPPFQMDMERYLDEKATTPLDSFDWIVMANVLSPLAQGRTVEEYCARIQRLLEQHRTPTGYPALTVIEGSCCKYVLPHTYMKGLTAQLKVLCNIGLDWSVPLDRPDILNCTYYKTGTGGCKPRIMMITVRKEAQ